MPLIGVLVDMEWEGIAIDGEHFARLAAQMRGELAQLEREHPRTRRAWRSTSTPRRSCGTCCSRSSQLPVLKKGKTGASTDAEVLEELAGMGHAVPRLLLEYREISKLLSTYLDVLPAEVNPATGRIHTSFNQIGAATGRLSSNDPNLQNIPVRSARGEAIRRGFVPRPGHRFIVADYSQIELRLLAHLSGDPAFVAAFRAGGDIHRQTAALIFGVAPEAVTAEMRGRAKTINFATIYGQGPHALARQLGIPYEDARNVHRRLLRPFRRACGASSTARWKRRRRGGTWRRSSGGAATSPNCKDKNFSVRAFGERTATNSPLQGSAADLIKVAMIKVNDAVRARFAAKLLLQVHDELVVEAPQAEAEDVARLVKDCMEGAAVLSVPLVATVGIGPNWLDAKAG